jgi:putative transposase
VKYQFIDTNRHSYTVKALCQAIRVSGYYTAPRTAAERTQRTANVTDLAHPGNSHCKPATYGAPRIHAELSAQGVACSRNTVDKLMRQAQIMPKAIRRFRAVWIIVRSSILSCV